MNWDVLRPINYGLLGLAAFAWWRSTRPDKPKPAPFDPRSLSNLIPCTCGSLERTRTATVIADRIVDGEVVSVPVGAKGVCEGCGRVTAVSVLRGGRYDPSPHSLLMPPPPPPTPAEDAQRKSKPPGATNPPLVPRSRPNV